ncbi:hypothetical protein GWK26_11830 [haloarchaeon 3A1-DGR]|nr:hypothetical protein GWK26_11830 [haloarchaeon 3A1-DGR]
MIGALVDALGLTGVSTAALALLAVALYAHRAATVGSMAVSTGRVVTHDLKMISLVLALMMLVGVISVDPARAQQLGQQAIDAVATRLDWRVIVDWLRGAV